MKKVNLFLGLILVIGVLQSCDHDTVHASEKITSLEYSIPAYAELKVSDAFTTYVTFSDREESVRIEADNNLHDKMVVKNEGNALVIRLKNSTSVRGNATLNVYIVTKDITAFDIAGASRVTLENEWIVSDGSIALSGASDFSGAVNSDRLHVDLAGASRLDLFGNTASLNAKLSGSSVLRDYDLNVEHLNIDLSGASEVFLSVNETIDIKGSGASILNYKGSAIVENRELSGSSEVKNRN